MKKDYLSTLREHLRSYHATEQELIATNPTLCEADEENDSDSCKWLRLPIPGATPSTEASMILSDIALFPDDCLAGILVAAMKNRVPTGIRVSSVGIDRIGNSFQFCIAGSTTLEELRTLCEQYRARLCPEDAKRIGCMYP